jgi:hypothetical protein
LEGSALMTASQHLLVLFSIVLGLGLTQLLASIQLLTHPATKTKWHWLPIYWTVSVFTSLIFWWWIMFFFESLDPLPNFFGVVLILLGPVLLYLLATSVLPAVRPGDTVDLLGFYRSNSRRLFRLAAWYTVVLWAQPFLFRWDIPLSQHVWAGITLLVFVTLSRTQNLRIHAVLTTVNGLMLLASLATTWNRIE